MKRDHAQVLAGRVPDVFAQQNHSERIGYSKTQRPGGGEGGHLEPERVEAVLCTVSGMGALRCRRVHLTSMRVVSFSNSRSFGPSSVRSGSLKDPRPHPGRAQVEPRLHEFHDGLVLLRRGRVLVLTQCC